MSDEVQLEDLVVSLAIVGLAAWGLHRLQRPHSRLVVRARPKPVVQLVVCASCQQPREAKA